MTSTDLVKLWLRQALASGKVHYRIGSRLSRQGGALTAAVVIATTAVGSSLFGLLNETASESWKLALAVLSTIAAVLVAVQRTLNLAEQAEKNRRAGSEWERVVNKATVALTYGPRDPRLQAAVEELEAMIDEVIAKSPQIPQKQFNKAGLDMIYADLEALAH